MIRLSSIARIRAKHPNDRISRQDVGHTIIVYIGHPVTITPNMVGVTAHTAYKFQEYEAQDGRLI